jgi:hypothetical protein
MDLDRHRARPSLHRSLEHQAWPPEQHKLAGDVVAGARQNRAGCSVARVAEEPRQRTTVAAERIPAAVVPAHIADRIAVAVGDSSAAVVVVVRRPVGRMREVVHRRRAPSVAWHMALWAAEP